MGIAGCGWWHCILRLYRKNHQNRKSVSMIEVKNIWTISNAFDITRWTQWKVKEWAVLKWIIQHGINYCTYFCFKMHAYTLIYTCIDIQHSCVWFNCTCIIIFFYKKTNCCLVLINWLAKVHVSKFNDDVSVSELFTIWINKSSL